MNTTWYFNRDWRTFKANAKVTLYRITNKGWWMKDIFWNPFFIAETEFLSPYPMR